MPEHYVRPRTREAFWSAKLRTNVDRDRAQTQRLEELGWTVLRVWEHDIFHALPDVIARIRGVLDGDLEIEHRENWRVVAVEVVNPETDTERRIMEDFRRAEVTRSTVGPRITRNAR